MELWFTEPHTKDARFSMKVDRQIFSAKSEFQRIDIFDTIEFGRVLVLDGYTMLTEKDEFMYHEMIAHVPLCAHPDARRVLVIGGGDGGTVRELTRYDAIERIDMVEIDEAVVKACREHLPQTAGKLGDPRVKLHYEDGLKFIRHHEAEYDVIIVDSTDPFGPGEGLFTREFYGNCYRALADDGVMVNQHESPFYEETARAMRRAHKRIVSSFPLARVYQLHIPTYPSGHWLFGFASKKLHPVKGVDWARWENLGIKTRYYNTKLHAASFALPTYVEEMLKSEEPDE